LLSFPAHRSEGFYRRCACRDGGGESKGLNAERWRPGAAALRAMDSSETFADEKVAGRGDEGAVDFSAEEQAEVAGVEGEEHLAAVG